MGRPSHKPDEKSLGYVRAMASYGVPHASIAEAVGISEPTLRKHYGTVMKRAEAEANAQVGKSLFRQAAGAPAEFDEDKNEIREEQKPVASATIFWAKCRMGWRQTDKLEVSAKVSFKEITPDQLKDLSPDELEKLDAALPVLEKLGIVGVNSSREEEA